MKRFFFNSKKRKRTNDTRMNEKKNTRERAKKLDAL